MTEGKSGEEVSAPDFWVEPNTLNSARLWNYWLGGKDHDQFNRRVGDEIRDRYPGIVQAVRECRYFRARAVRYLAHQEQVRQFLDVGFGLPYSDDNTHQVAQGVARECRVVYVDHDPVVMAHARALLTPAQGGVCGYVEADLRDPDTIIAQASQTLDFRRPIALILASVVDHLSEADDPYGVVAGLMGALPAGSFLVINHATNVVGGGRAEAAARYWNQHCSGGGPLLTLRTPGQIAQLFDGLDLLEPGVVPCSRWRPDHTPWGAPAEVNAFGGVATKPGP